MINSVINIAKYMFIFYDSIKVEFSFYVRVIDLDIKLTIEIINFINFDK